MRYVTSLLLLLSLTGCADERAAFPVNELGVRPPVLEGFSQLSPEDLSAGKLLLLDGVSLYGWETVRGAAAVFGGHLVTDNGGAELRCWLPPGMRLIHGGGSVERGTKKTAGGSGGASRNVAPNAPESFAYDWNGETLTLRLETPTVACDFVNFCIEPIAETAELLLADDLAGWERRGKVEATCKDGVLRLQGGSGSLEYTSPVADFLLQLEFKTESPVNSGLFFRCIPESTMDGYECQLFNNPPEGDFAKFLGTQTGGLFRRQVGRDVAPRDGEWVAVSILANSNKFATWVNGVQVTSWEDTRSGNTNPRSGCRTEAGTIQLQGHDPTTDILFRNIRLVRFE